MLSKPAGCAGCPLQQSGEGFTRPSLAVGGYGVTLIGESLRSEEVASGEPFSGAGSYKLTKLIEYAGLDRSKFNIIPSLWCSPQEKWIEGSSWLPQALKHCRTAHQETILAASSVIVPMGNIAMRSLGMNGSALEERGYIHPSQGAWIIPTVHPLFIQKGQSKYSAAFIHDLQKAVRLAQEGMTYETTNYLIDPLPDKAYAWAVAYQTLLASNPHLRLAYDIETPGKGEDEGELDSGDHLDKTYHIYRIGFSHTPGMALTVPWTPAYIPAIRLLLESQGEKVVWNAGFDNPRIAAKGVAINGLIHDGMIAWHILHSDMPKGLGFVATFTCPFQAAWKHTSHQNPGRYNCIDADVELRSMEWIEQQLRATGLWEVYDRDVIQLDPILHFMTSKGMPIDADVRLDRATKLQEEYDVLVQIAEAIVPTDARTWSPKAGFVKQPGDTANLITIGVDGPVRRCSICGAPKPTKPHFKTLKRPTAAKPQNPCSGGVVVTTVERIQRYARLDPFKLSREQIIRYNDLVGRATPVKSVKGTNKKTRTTDDKAIKQLMRKWPDDKLYPLVLDLRKIQKLQGTYVGYVEAPADDTDNM